MSTPTNVSNTTNSATLAALGTIAYVGEALLHEAAGHGGMCLATGGRITLLTALYMRCSELTILMVAAGPGMNLLVGLLSLLLLQRREAISGIWRYTLWLAFLFNWLVAAGYAMVGAATRFGDWDAMFAPIRPSWLWRVPLGVGALFFYAMTLRLASRIFVRITGLVQPDLRTRTRLILLPTGAATLVALAAQLYGQGTGPLGVGLALGCTLVPGATLVWAFDGKGAQPGSPLRIPFSGIWSAAGGLIAAGFILFIGPGLDLSGS
jgi:hypothetical protein